MSRFWSSLTHDLKPYVQAKQPRIADLVKLNTNESPLGSFPTRAGSHSRRGDRYLASVSRPAGVSIAGCLGQLPPGTTRTSVSSATVPTRYWPTSSPLC